jgi:alkanesulfonate monooxygenase SsuD/methylene tetrahydromethanopterin reductase-like flavin-dependent oxidoreductase (luciferase family)
VSFRLYAHSDLGADDIVAELRAQAVLAEAAGFSGVMTSEHHNGFPGYMPNPIQVAGWALEATERLWAAPCPLLLPLRPVALVVEEMAWLSARFPGRVALGVAAGSLESDFAIFGTTKDGLLRRFSEGLENVARGLGRGVGDLADDPAVARCRTHPVPLVSAAMSAAAVRRAAASGVGLLFDSLTGAARCRELVEIYRQAGGDGPVIMIRRAWIGRPPTELQQRQLDRYRSYAAPAAVAHWNDDELLLASSAAEIAERLAGIAQATGVTAFNLRVHVPGVTPAEARGQLEGLAGIADLVSAAMRA